MSYHPILIKVSEYYNVNPSGVVAKDRHEPIATIRGVAIHFMHLSGMNDGQIAEQVNLLYPSGVCKVRTTLRNRLCVDIDLACDVANIKAGRKSDVTFATKLAERRIASDKFWNNAPRKVRDVTCGIPTHKRHFDRIKDETDEKDEPSHYWFMPFERENGMPGFGSLKHLERLMMA